MNEEKKLFLLDAYALIYRAYFAFVKNPRINSKGLDTSAIFGFTNTLLEIINKEKPSHIAVVFDTQKPTQRHLDYPDYKAHREAMPDGLRDALPYIDQLLEAFNISKLYKDGYEADDVIGTIAKKAEKEGFEVYMMTPDKDFAQLVTDNIFIYKPANKWQQATIWGVPEVLNKFKIQRIDQVIDFLGMMGDSADNIPGILGVGEKTAQKFLEKYGSMEGLFANTHKLKGKIKEKIENSKDIAFLCKKLVTIITDVPIEFDSQSLLLGVKNNNKVKDLFDKLEFRNLSKKMFSLSIDNNITQDKNPSVQKDLFSQLEQKEDNKRNIYECIIEEERLNELKLEIAKKGNFSIQLVVDNQIDLNEKVVGFSLCYNLNHAYYLPVSEKSLLLIQELCENLEIQKTGYDLKKTIRLLLGLGVKLKGSLFDIQVAHYLLHPDMRHALEIVSDNYLGVMVKTESDILGKGKLKKTYSDLEPKIITAFASEIAAVIFKLQDVLAKEMKKSLIWDLFIDIEMPLIIVLAKMEKEGINLDVNMLKRYSAQLTSALFDKQQRIYDLAGQEFNVLSPKQLGGILFNNLSISTKIKKTKSGQFSTSEETLVKLIDKHPIVKEILEYRELKKLLSTYVDALPKLVNLYTKRIHTTFNQSVASTGRLSSTNPNLQNIPIRTTRGKKIREAFISRNQDFILLAADYSQIELRIMASLSQDSSLLAAFINGEDIHSATAARVYGVDLDEVTRDMRSKAKAVNFGIIYGISPFGLSQNIGVSRSEAKEIIDNYFIQFPKVKEYMNNAIIDAKENEYVETLMGRRRYLKDINSRNAVVRGVAERNAINAPIQGLAADIIKKAMIDIQNELDNGNMKSRMLIQVHDELVFDMHKSEIERLKQLVKEKMEKAFNLQVPLIVDLGSGHNWLEAH